MAHRSARTCRTLLALALSSCAAGALAANPLGFAVAAAPSMFVLAVAEAAPDRADAKPGKADTPRQPPREGPAPDAARSAQAAAQAVREDPANERKVTLR